jgi:cytochrome c biogenesis protein CcmG/thiol:disulfide interchange protein DsbE
MIRFLPLLIFLFFAAIFAFALLMDGARPQMDLAGKALPALNATPLAGNVPAPIPIAGEKLLINFFASWCTPCIGEHPQLAKLQADGVRIIGIAWNDTPEAVRAFLEQQGNPYHAVYLDTKGESAVALGIRGVPESFAVDANGTIRAHWAGPISADIVRSAWEE